MKPFVPREKLGKKARRALDQEKRERWTFSPVTRKVESKKIYNRKRKSHDRYDSSGMGFLLPVRVPWAIRSSTPRPDVRPRIAA